MFYSDKFLYNNVYSEDMGVALVSFDDEILNEYGMGISKGIERISNNTYSPMYKDSEDDSKPIVLPLASVDEVGESISWDSEKIKLVIEWMMQKEFCQFISEDDSDIVYYLKCIGYTKKFSASMEGIIEFEMKPYTSYAYTHRKETEKTIDGSGKMVIINNSNLVEDYKPLIKITPHSNEDIYITNVSLKAQPFILTNVTNNESVIIDNKMGTVTTSKGKNKIMDCNRKWIEIKGGHNLLEVNGKCYISVVTQFPILV